MTQFVLHSLRHALARPLLLLVLSLWTLHGLQAQTDKPVILVFGDSLSAGYRMEEAQGWVALLADRLAAQNSPFEVMNASVSGDTTSGGRARLPALLARHQPTHVVIELGGNDALRGLPVSSTEDNLSQMTDVSRKAGAKVLLIGMQVPPNYGAEYGGQFAGTFARVASKYKVALVPFLLKGVADGPDAERLFQADRIHPREEAQPVMLENVWPLLKRLL